LDTNQRYIDAICRLTDHLPCTCGHTPPSCDVCIVRGLKSKLSVRQKFLGLVANQEPDHPWVVETPQTGLGVPGGGKDQS
jgi:hypothetical protein